MSTHRKEEHWKTCDRCGEARAVSAEAEVAQMENARRNVIDGLIADVAAARRERDTLAARVAALEAAAQAAEAVSAMAPEKPAIYGVDKMRHGHAVRRAFEAGIHTNRYADRDIFDLWIASPVRADLAEFLDEDEARTVDYPGRHRPMRAGGAS